MKTVDFDQLVEFMKRIPSVDSSIYSGVYENENWWIKFSIDIDHDLAWNVVQELGHIIKYVSLNDRLPTIFYPVSAPPYLNGGPRTYLHWIIESNQTDFAPQDLKNFLEGRLPNPVDNMEEWNMED